MRRRNNPGGPRLAAFVAVLATAAPAKASTTGFEGFDPANPIVTTAKELVRIVRLKCNLGERDILIGTASVPVQEQLLTRDQGHHIMNSVHGAFSGLPGVRMAPFADIGAVNEIRAVGMFQNVNSGDAREQFAKLDLVVRLNAQRVGRNIRFTLVAVGMNSVSCFEATPPVDIENAFVGEVFMSTDAIFNQAAKEMWERSRGVNQISMNSAKTITGERMDLTLFTTRMRQAVSHTRQYATENLGTPTELQVVPGERATASAEQRWNGEVVVEPRPNGARINLDFSRDNATAISTYGIVPVDELPALRRQDMLRTASVIRNAPSQRGKLIEAAVLTFQAAPTRVLDTIDGDVREQRYAFSVRQESYVEFDADVKKGSGRVMIMELYDSNGNVVQPMFEGKARPNLRRYRLSSGNFELRARTDAQGRHEYLLSSRAVDVTRMLMPEMPGKLTRQFQDWYAGEMMRVGKKTCYVFTVATDVVPVGWREQRPIVFMSFEEGAGSPLNHLLDTADRYQPLSAQKAVFHGAAGVEPMEVRALKANIQPIATGGSGEPVLNREAVKGYTRGTSIELSGTAPDGKATSVRYSLRGYRSAVNAAAINCGRTDLARDLVWQ
ncbi:MAG: hypothetical protein ACRC7C_08950 [Beijerinckiaceae bacterium]